MIARPGLELVAAVDPAVAGTSVAALLGMADEPAGDGSGGSTTGLPVVAGDLDALTDAGTEVVVDFTRLDVSRTTMDFCLRTGIHAVIGSTGFTEEDLAELTSRFDPDTGTSAHGVVAANFAIGAVLMMRFAALAAPWFDAAEIIELHHDGKRDAPSGTSLRTAEGMAAARRGASLPDYPADATETAVVPGARGGSGPGGVRMHSVRLPGLVAHQEVLFGATGQGLVIRHDSFDRVSFMDGVILAVESVASRPGLTLGLEPLLGI